MNTCKFGWKGIGNMKAGRLVKIDFLFLAVTALLGMLWFYTWHDMHTADGVGLYLSLLAGKGDRSFFDMLADLAGILGMAGIMLIPCVFCKKLRARSLFRLFSAAMAFLPLVKPGNLVHFPDNLLAFEIRQEILEKNYLNACFHGFAGVIGLFQVCVPLLVVLSAAGLWNVGKLFQNVSLPVFSFFFLLLAFAGFLCEEISMETDFILYYALLVLAFSFWEKVFERDVKQERWSLVFFALCAVRGIYRNIVLLSVTHM